MKLSTLNPTNMKKATQPHFYFSAYPLKVINQPEQEKKNYLHIHTKRNGKIKYSESLKVLPMVNPYSEKDVARLIQKADKQIPCDNIEERDSDWFASYE